MKERSTMKFYIDLHPHMISRLKSRMTEKGIHMKIDELCYVLMIFGFMHFEKEIDHSNIDDYLCSLSDKTHYGN